MRDVARQAHANQTRNGGRLPYWVHTDAVADICHQALRVGAELPPDAEEDLVVAAYGHDLYEDTTVSAEYIQENFGARVDSWIDGMTNRMGDHDTAGYLRQLAAADDEVRVIKCADLIDNMLSVAYGLHDLGLTWANDFFMPIARETRDVLRSTPFARLPRTGGHMIGLVDWAWERLTSSMATAAAVEEDFLGPENRLSPQARAMVERLSFTEEQWAASKAAYEAEQEERARQLFGDQKRFAIPDVETDA